jgi:hypothetical protein
VTAKQFPELFALKMKEVEEFRRYAETCRKLSYEVADASSKRQLVEMATVWMLLANEREEELRASSADTQTVDRA